MSTLVFAFVSYAHGLFNVKRAGRIIVKIGWRKTIVFSSNCPFMGQGGKDGPRYLTVLQKRGKVYTAMSPFRQPLTEQFWALSKLRRVCVLAKCIVSASLFCLSKTLDISSHSSSGCLCREEACSQSSSRCRESLHAALALGISNSIPCRIDNHK